MKYYILFLLLFNSVLYSQNNLESALKMYSDKNWYYIKKENDKFVFYNYCKPLWFKFNAKEFITNDGAYGNVEKYKIEKVLYNEKNKSLEIYSEINGVTLKRIITKNHKYTLNIRSVFFVDIEDESSISYNHDAIVDSEFKKLKIVKACNLNKSTKVKKIDSIEEPPAPPQ